MFRNSSRINWRRLMVSLLSLGLSVAAPAQSTEFPTYHPGENAHATTGPTYSQPFRKGHTWFGPGNEQARLHTPCSMAGTQTLAGHRLQVSSIKTRERPPGCRHASPIASTNNELLGNGHLPSCPAPVA